MRRTYYPSLPEKTGQACDRPILQLHASEVWYLLMLATWMATYCQLFLALWRPEKSISRNQLYCAIKYKNYRSRDKTAGEATD